MVFKVKTQALNSLWIERAYIFFLVQKNINCSPSGKCSVKKTSERNNTRLKEKRGNTIKLRGHPVKPAVPP
jgi:hypothetical protein